MRDNRIDFISAYCDRWCERCAFTSRCSTYAVEMAIGMCEGDVKAAIELAVGAPPPATEAEARRRETFLASLPNEKPSKKEMEEYTRVEEARDERIDESPITTLACKVSMLARDWLEKHQKQLDTADIKVKDAIEVAGWDAYFIEAKLHRALHGRDEYAHDEDFDDDPVQNDWNGSAKVALISIVRSTIAWKTIADATSDSDTLPLVQELQHLRLQVEKAFPDAWNFIRPGFDNPGR